jgi:hypothetical protein
LRAIGKDPGIEKFRFMRQGLADPAAVDFSFLNESNPLFFPSKSGIGDLRNSYFRSAGGAKLCLLNCRSL